VNWPAACFYQHPAGWGSSWPPASWDIWPLAWIAFVPLFFGDPECAAAGWPSSVAGPRALWRIWGVLLDPTPPAALRPDVAPIGLFLFFLLALYQGLHFGVFAWLLSATRPQLPRMPWRCLHRSTSSSLELVTPFIFPWYIAISQAWVIPVIQVADVTGPLGVSCLLVLSAALLFELAQALARRAPIPWIATAAGASIIGGSLAYGAVRLDQVQAIRARAKKIDVGIVQANIGIDEKGSTRRRLRHHQIHLEESWKLQRAGADLLVWSESSYPFWFDRAQTRDYLAGDPRRVMQGIEVPLIFGAVSYGQTEPYPYNTAFMLAPDGRVLGRFDKNFLLIFGEYIPFYEHIPSFKKWFPAASHFARGTSVTTFPLGEQRIGPDDLLRGHHSSVWPTPCAAATQSAGEYHERRVVRPHRRALRAHGAPPCSGASSFDSTWFEP